VGTNKTCKKTFNITKSITPTLIVKYINTIATGHNHHSLILLQTTLLIISKNNKKYANLPIKNDADDSMTKTTVSIYYNTPIFSM
ncbi:MAG: hypothetical protein ACRC9V_09530, partial [Aeromonas sp.]